MKPLTRLLIGAVFGGTVLRAAELPGGWLDGVVAVVVDDGGCDEPLRGGLARPHGRHRDAVAQRQAGECEWREERRHGNVT